MKFVACMSAPSEMLEEIQQAKGKSHQMVTQIHRKKWKTLELGNMSINMKDYTYVHIFYSL